jgi:hypothetical protein
MKDETKTAIVVFVLLLLLVIFFKNVVHKPIDVVPLYLIPIFLWIGYVTGRVGAKLWMGMTLFLTLAMAILYAFF